MIEHLNYRGWKIWEGVRPKAKTAIFRGESGKWSFRADNMEELRSQIDEHENQSLAERWYHDGDYQVPETLLEQFEEKVRELAKQMFCDGKDTYDLPVQIKIIDRTRYSLLEYHETPKDRSLNTPEDVQETQLDLLAYNLQIASRELDREIRMRRLRIYEKNKIVKS